MVLSSDVRPSVVCHIGVFLYVETTVLIIKKLALDYSLWDCLRTPNV